MLGVGILLAPGILLGDCVPGPGLGLAWAGEGGPPGLEKLGLRCTGLTIRAPLAGELNTHCVQGVMWCSGAAYLGRLAAVWRILGLLSSAARAAWDWRGEAGQMVERVRLGVIRARAGTSPTLARLTAVLVWQTLSACRLQQTSQSYCGETEIRCNH